MPRALVIPEPFGHRPHRRRLSALCLHQHPAARSPLDPEATSVTWAAVGEAIALVYANPPGFAIVDPKTNKAGPPRSVSLCNP